MTGLPMLVVSSSESKGVSPLFSINFPKEDATAFCGELTTRRHTHISHLQIRGAGSLVTEERPENLLGPIKLFVCGYVLAQ